MEHSPRSDGDADGYDPQKDACEARQASSATGAALSHRQLTHLAAALAMGAVGQTVAVRARSATPASPDPTSPGRDALQTVLAQTAPQSGFQSRIALGDSVPRLVAAGILDTE